MKARKGDTPSGYLRKKDSKSLSYYNKNMPSYRWPKKFGKQHQEKYDIKALFLEKLALEKVQEMPDLDIAVTKKKYSQNFHAGRLDLNVVYDKRKKMIAHLIAGIIKMVQERMRKDKGAHEKPDAP